MECILCRIAKKEVSAKIVFENETVIAVEDIAPKAKIHILIFPKKHISESIHNEKSQDTILEVFKAARAVAKRNKLKKTGYRVLTNHGEDAGQSVPHLHFHLLGGEKLKQI